MPWWLHSTYWLTYKNIHVHTRFGIIHTTHVCTIYQRPNPIVQTVVHLVELPIVRYGLAAMICYDDEDEADGSADNQDNSSPINSKSVFCSEPLTILLSDIRVRFVVIL